MNRLDFEKFFKDFLIQSELVNEVQFVGQASFSNRKNIENTNFFEYEFTKHKFKEVANLNFKTNIQESLKKMSYKVEVVFYFYFEDFLYLMKFLYKIIFFRLGVNMRDYGFDFAHSNIFSSDLEVLENQLEDTTNRRIYFTNLIIEYQED